MKIENYKNLIVNLPVREQAFTTKRSTWEYAEKDFSWLKIVNDDLFQGEETLTISRQDIFDSHKSIKVVILKTIYWGYTGGMRGNHFIKLLGGDNFNKLESMLIKHKANLNLTTSDFTESIKIVKGIGGIGLSTYSKMLYFLDVRFDNNPCLILDQRLISVFSGKIYEEFTLINKIRYDNTENYYLEYLDLVNKASIILNTKGENIEQFLFMFGNNLKPVS
ncbi:hypothetical protein ACFGVS_12830 [Mucilaginibacter sp. AW1-7]|uniref:8-oxoguanine DNA glycosylase OGG fold protein n=1 Tax=Mucilaginibacter sp. AW1-7 TaxID=3349874 RepID=UPI003F74155C